MKRIPLLALGGAAFLVAGGLVSYVIWPRWWKDRYAEIAARAREAVGAASPSADGPDRAQVPGSGTQPTTNRAPAPAVEQRQPLVSVAPEAQNGAPGARAADD
ncbi:MAG: hypothetical protein HY719_10970, partial [Planctomycetes bacterium]|nr:hypothetical protein [Planctomycetota bacterium]